MIMVASMLITILKNTRTYQSLNSYGASSRCLCFVLVVSYSTFHSTQLLAFQDNHQTHEDHDTSQTNIHTHPKLTLQTGTILIDFRPPSLTQFQNKYKLKQTQTNIPKDYTKTQTFFSLTKN